VPQYLAFLHLAVFVVLAAALVAYVDDIVSSSNAIFLLFL
jgi:hypothetical protein